MEGAWKSRRSLAVWQACSRTREPGSCVHFVPAQRPSETQSADSHVEQNPNASDLPGPKPYLRLQRRTRPCPTRGNKPRMNCIQLLVADKSVTRRHNPLDISSSQWPPANHARPSIVRSRSLAVAAPIWVLKLFYCNSRRLPSGGISTLLPSASKTWYTSPVSLGCRLLLGPFLLLRILHSTLALSRHTDPALYR